MENGMQFVSKLFETLCAFIGTEYVTTTPSHLQTNGQGDSAMRRISKAYNTVIKRQDD